MKETKIVKVSTEELTSKYTLVLSGDTEQDYFKNKKGIVYSAEFGVGGDYSIVTLIELGREEDISKLDELANEFISRFLQEHKAT